MSKFESTMGALSLIGIGALCALGVYDECREKTPEELEERRIRAEHREEERRKLQETKDKAISMVDRYKYYGSRMASTDVVERVKFDVQHAYSKYDVQRVVRSFANDHYNWRLSSEVSNL